MGWLILLLLVAFSIGLLWALGVRGGLLIASASALLVGASGYALQGQPNVPGATVAAGEGHDVFPLTAPFFYGLALARSGDRERAVAVWQQILKTAPKDAQWRPLVEQGVAALSGQRNGAKG